MEKEKFSLRTIEKVLILFAFTFYVVAISATILNIKYLPETAFVVGFCLLIFLIAEILKDTVTYKLLADTVSADHDEPVDWQVKKNRLMNDVALLKSERDNQIQTSKDLEKDNKQLQDEITSLKDEIEQMKVNQIKVEEDVTENQNVSYGNLLPGNEDNTKKINIVQEAKAAAEELESELVKADINVNVNATDENMIVLADPEKIKVMFRNIIDNSIKYMKKSGQLVITISHLEDMIFIVLKDNGKGLKNDEVDRIFELNFQGSNRVSGNGLGLAQTKAIVEYYHGTIYARSSEDGGMGIYIQIPAN